MCNDLFSVFTDENKIHDDSGLVVTNEGNITNTITPTRLSYRDTNTTCCLRTENQEQTIQFNFLQGKLCCINEDCQQTITLTDASGEVKSWSAPLEFSGNQATINTQGNTVLYFEQTKGNIRYSHRLPLYVINFKSEYCST